MKTCAWLLTIALLASPVFGDAPTADFKKFAGQMYGESNQGQPAHHSHQELTLLIPTGTIIDPHYSPGNIACCGGDENRNGNSTSVPAGIYVEIGGGNAGEWGIFNIQRTSITDDDTGQLKGYKLSADLYCGPSATHGGCNVHLYGWAKLRRIPG